MSILDNGKAIAEAIHQVQNLDLYRQFLNYWTDVTALVGENDRLRSENRELKEELRLKSVMKFNAPFWYQDGDQTPFCPACWEAHHKAVHVVVKWKDQGDTKWGCPSCKSEYIVQGERFRDPWNPNSKGWMES